ncbi:helix-turn-helix transcriptional regulator [Iodobacter sp. CM08]|uniref:helix-turn-helix transcriptional regulator n=1 Tax=Iodobacter sp. CM08 TaxID=3085902 RepID=UPI00298192BA|nr:helix-turn-helix transcriptional regulator [Iodobacter sp. CM08]MDW5417726.1 helix-turn-helix transcriptional regulator [Iodobacter sp. CM08]
MSTFSYRVRQRRQELGLTQGEVAKRAGVAQPTIALFESGRNKSTNAVVALAEALQCNPLWLEQGKGPMTGINTTSLRPIQVWDNEDELDPDIYVFIPSLDIKLSAGSGNIVWEVDFKGQQQAFRRKWAERVGIDPKCAATMVADGNSMEPRILDGDSLVVDYCQTQVSEGKVYALAIEGEVFVKRIHKEIGGSLRISSDNVDKNKYPDKFIPAELTDQVQIIGRVIAVSGGI